MSESQRQMDTARSRGIQLKEILNHDLTTENCLFDGDYTAKTKQKHVLANELEKLINHNAPQFLKYSSEPRTLLVSVMSVIRRVPLKNVSKIISAIKLSWNNINNICIHNLHKSAKETEKAKKIQ